MTIKWSAFSAGSAIAGSDIPVGLQSGGNVQWTWTQVRTFLLGTATSFLSIAAGKTLTASNSLTLAGTDSTVMTFPTTSATIARTDAGNTFTGAQTITGILTTQSGRVLSGRVVTAAGAITMATTDNVVIVNKTVGAATTVNLVGSPTTWTSFTIKDGKGDAGTNNITITPAAGTIDGASTYVMGTNYQSATVVYSGSEWSVI